MGDLALDTAVEHVGEGRYAARLSDEWEIWGPMGGYVAAIALRAAGAASPFARPASFFCHYLGVAAFDRVELGVSTLRAGRSALSQRVSVTQGARPILEATVWSVAENDGLEHDEAVAPDTPRPDELRPIDELVPDPPNSFAFWNNVEMRPVGFRENWPPSEPLPPVWQAWCRFRPTATFGDDPWVDACRSVILVDVQSWPAASPRHAWREPHGYIAPSLDLYVAFHTPAPTEEWLLADGYAPVSRDGMFGWTGRLWTPGGDLVATGAGQALYRRVPSPG
jgi:acyl-CoA thioesterase-2